MVRLQSTHIALRISEVLLLCLLVCILFFPTVEYSSNTTSSFVIAKSVMSLTTVLCVKIEEVIPRYNTLFKIICYAKKIIYLMILEKFGTLHKFKKTVYVNSLLNYIKCAHMHLLIYYVIYIYYRYAVKQFFLQLYFIRKMIYHF